MRRLAPLLAAVWLLAAGLAPAAVAAEASEYGIEPGSFIASLFNTQAGGHSDFTTTFKLSTDPKTKAPFAPTRALEFHFPPGIVGNVAAFPKCTARQLTTGLEENGETCPIDSQVGVTEVAIYSPQIGEGLNGSFTEPVYNMAPPPGVTARLGFAALIIPTFIDVRLDPESGYGLTASLQGLSALKIIGNASTTLWGDPTDPVHDFQRVTPLEVAENKSHPRPSSLLPTPFMASPTSCGPPQTLSMSATSYEAPGKPSTATALLPQITGCGLLDFKPNFSLTPTTSQAETPTGLEVELKMPQQGLEHPNLLVESHLKRAEVDAAGRDHGQPLGGGRHRRLLARRLRKRDGHLGSERRLPGNVEDRQRDRQQPGVERGRRRRALSGEAV